MEYIVIVDSYSAGKLLPEAFSNRDFCVVHVRSDLAVSASLGDYQSDFFSHDIKYNGDMRNLVDELKKIIGTDDILAVLAGSEPGVLLADRLGNQLKLENTNEFSLSSARRNKYEMRKALSQKNIKNPKFIKARTFKELEDWIDSEKISYPLVLKPLDSAGSDGVAVVHSVNELKTAFNRTHGQTNVMGSANQALLVETFLNGNEYVINSVSCNGKHKIVDIWVYNKKTLPSGHVIYDNEQLIDFSDPIVNKISPFLQRVLNALGFKYGPSHAEIMMTDQGPILVEVGARLSGATNVKMSKKCLGYSPIDLVVDSFVNEDAFVDRLNQENKLLAYAMVIDYATEQEGLIEREAIAERLHHLPSLITMLVKKRAGDTLEKTTNLLTSPAKFHLAHKNKEQLITDYNTVLQICKNGFKIKPKVYLISLPGCNAAVQEQVPLASVYPKFPYVHGTHENSEVMELLKKTNLSWSKRAKVRKFDVESIMEFYPNKPDFLESLLPFSEHILYQNATNEIKQKILSCGWIIYNEKTVTIETDVVNPFCSSVINGHMPGLTDEVSRDTASETMTDESFHTLLVVRSNNHIKTHRNLNLELPQFNLTKYKNQFIEKLQESWEKELVSAVTAIVSEVFISDYLKLLTKADGIQPMNLAVVKAHYADEMVHGKVFKLLAKNMFANLNTEQREFFADVLYLPSVWFADNELDVWLSALQQINFKNAESMIADTKLRNASNIENLDFSEVNFLARELGIVPKTELYLNCNY